MLVTMTSATPLVWAYGEDVPDDDHSTAHYDMALAMARCSGFEAADATTIAEADEVVDTLAYGDTAFEFASRTGRLKEYFHFPERGGSVDGNGDGPLRAWAEGTSTLTDANGVVNACDAAGTCCDTKGQCVTKGSPEAIGAWLHAVGDYWSHHACTVAGGTDHMTYELGNMEQAAYCAPTMHNHEWGRRETTGYYATLQANAIRGLQAMRDALTSYAAGRGLTACGAISDADLVDFASQTSSALRVSAAHALYVACDAACPQGTGGDGVGDAGVSGEEPANAPAGCGCTSAAPGDALAMLLVLGLLRRRPRPAR
jgi:hypothetical protein